MIAVLVASFGLAFAHPVHAETGAINTILSTLAGVAMSVAEVIGRLVVAVLDLTIPIMQYQGFTTSPVVVAGWAIVRDVVNMFFVVVLIVIAMGTIFGGSRFQWKQQVPKLMIFAVVINFSKTLCGIMIDFAQVVMLTFANALKDIAGGNFIQLLGLGPIFSLSEEAANKGVVSDAFGLFTAAAAAVLMMVWVLAVVIMLLFILVYRVVMLWILIVLAPLAWFMGGQSVFKSDAYAEWWKNFICYTAIGPVIVFFLWLTLAVAGSGVIAAKDSGFSSVLSADGSSPINNTSGNLTEIFELQHLASFVIGMAMLMAGFDAASKICSGVKGPGFQAMLSMGKGVPGKIGGFVGGQTRKYGGKALAAGFSGAKSAVSGSGYGLAAAGLAVAGGAGVGALALGKGGQAARAKGLRDLSKKTPFGIGATALSAASDARQKDLAEQLKKSAEAFKESSTDSKVEELKRVAKNGLAHGDAGEAQLGLLAEAIKDPKMRGKLEDAGVLESLYNKHGKTVKERLRNTPDSKTVDDFEEARPDIALKGLDPAAREKELEKMYKEVEDVKKIDAKAFKNNPALLNRLRQISGKQQDEKGNELSALDLATRGRFGDKAQADVLGQMSPFSIANDAGKYNSAEGTFTDPAFARIFTAGVKNNPDSLRNVDASVFRANGGVNAASSAAAEGLSQEKLQTLFGKLQSTSDPVLKQQYQKALDNAKIVIGNARASGVDKEKFDKLDTFYDKTEARIAGRPTTESVKEEAGAYARKFKEGEDYQDADDDGKKELLRQELERQKTEEDDARWNLEDAKANLSIVSADDPEVENLKQQIEAARYRTRKAQAIKAALQGGGKKKKK